MIDWTEVGKMPMPTKEELAKELFVEPGLRTLNQKEYDRQRRLRLIKEGKIVLKGPHNRFGKGNANYKHGRALNGPNAEYQRWRRAKLDKEGNV
tara:strand:- start:281 stop:562 length:282 start_codon:yes stop_codon:yes gene_type:complete